MPEPLKMPSFLRLLRRRCRRPMGEKKVLLLEARWGKKENTQPDEDGKKYFSFFFSKGFFLLESSSPALSSSRFVCVTACLLSSLQMPLFLLSLLE